MQTNMQMNVQMNMQKLHTPPRSMCSSNQKLAEVALDHSLIIRSILVMVVVCVPLVVCVHLL